MSDPTTPAHAVIEHDVRALDPILVGPGRWAIGEIVVQAKDEGSVLDEIQNHLRQVAYLEAVRRAMSDVDTCVVLDRVDELCQALYGVSLETFDRNGGKVHTRALFLMAQRELEREANPLKTTWSLDDIRKAAES